MFCTTQLPQSILILESINVIESRYWCNWASNAEHTVLQNQNLPPPECNTTTRDYKTCLFNIFGHHVIHYTQYSTAICFGCLIMRKGASFFTLSIPVCKCDIKLLLRFCSDGGGSKYRNHTNTKLW